MENNYTPAEFHALTINTILENDSKAYETIRIRALEVYKFEAGTSKLSDFIREYMENSVCDSIKGDGIGAWLIREVMLGWGVAPYDIIARDILAELENCEETRLYTLKGEGVKMRGTWLEIGKFLHKKHGQSVEYSLNFNGYTIN